MARYLSSSPRRFFANSIGRGRLRRRLVSLTYTLFAVYVLVFLLDHSWLSGVPVPSARSSTKRSVAAGNWPQETKDGLIVVEESSWRNEHPIRRLMREAREKWESQLARQSTTLEQAVKTYKIRYGRSPPKGFEAWWAFTQANNVIIVDDFDQIHDSITPFLPLDPTLIRSRLQELFLKESFSYQLHVRRNLPVRIVGERRDSDRAINMANLLEGFRQFLPDDFGEGSGSLGDGPKGDEGLVRLSISDGDIGSRVMGEDFRRRMMIYAKQGEYIDEEELKSWEETSGWDPVLNGLIKACSWKTLVHWNTSKPSSIYTGSSDQSEGRTNAPISFLKTPLKSFDFCHNPSVIPLHGTYARNIVRSRKISPQFVYSKIAQSPQILLTPLVAFHNKTGEVPSWEEKTINKIYWRGSTTGSHYARKNDFHWRSSHRIRLDTLANHPPVGSTTDVLVESEGGTVSTRRLDAREMNEHLFDVGITEVINCEEGEDGTCDEMRKEIKLAEYVAPQETALYRYAMDLDGNGWSSRFRRLVALGQVVFKVTIYPEWNSKWLTPWLHYIPVKLDLTDLYHISTFFVGAPGVSRGNSDLGKVISEAGLEFTEKFWRWEDHQAYMFRLLLEYRRAMASDRDAMSMGGKMALDASPPPFVPKSRVR